MRPIDTSVAAMMPRQRVTSTRCLAKPSRAGSSVTEATMVASTVRAAPMARPVTKARPITNMPHSEMTTVVPANSTARPAVLMAVAVASSVERPLWRPSR